MSTPLLRTSEMAAGYGNVPVITGVSITVEPGEVVALLGPNGAGKTTSLLAISAFAPLMGGEVELFGEAQGRGARRPHKLARQGLAHAPEDRSLFPGLTVREHLRVCRAPTGRATEDALRYFPALEPLLGRKAGLLSGGEQQMLTLARAFVDRPKLLLVDELSLGLAPVIVERLLPTLRQLADESGAGVLLVEQHVDLALEVADRAYVMNNGRIVIEGEAEEMQSRRDVLASSYLGGAALDEEGN
jgi:branched-chain amino acid transport system ATP-binding protein